ncbi:MAG: GIY-YIG nuclease family protein [Chloroflexi bacterium]|nr:GIY-YIG nuclease family protein [Chloroflexota bacterium]
MFLVDGTPDGVLTAEIINWTGTVTVAPRNQLPDLSKRDEVSRTGVYFIVGPDPKDEIRSMVYVGEGDNVLNRLGSHNRDPKKDFWTRAVIVTSKDDNLTKSHVRYLESKLIQSALESGRSTVMNETAPDPPRLPEPDVADMDYFLDQIQLVLPTLGFDFLQPRIAKPTATQSGLQQVKFILENVGVSAKALELGSEFVVLRGSTARKKGTASWVTFKRQRQLLIEDGTLIDSANSEFYEFAADSPFTSPSAAASAVLARQTNGRTAWKLESTGESYAEWQERELALVDNVL